MFTLISQRLEFNCTRCGKCCQKMADDFWVGGRLSWQQKQDLLEERKKYPDSTGCRMLYYQNDLACCLVETFIGEAKKENQCRIYPGANLCEKEIENG